MVRKSNFVRDLPCVNPSNISNGYYFKRRFTPDSCKPNKNLWYLLPINHLHIQQTVGCLTISKTESQNQTISHPLAVAHHTHIAHTHKV